MLDLGKAYGTHQGIVFFGDHENEKLIYYLPNKVSLSTAGGKYELFFQIYQEGKIVSGNNGTADELRKSSGSFLNLGVCCSVDPNKLSMALKEIKQQYSFDDDLSATAPLWKDGTVDLITLDNGTNVEEEESKEDYFARHINGGSKPSLITDDLKSIFICNYDSRGTELIFDALKGGNKSIAGVLYNLKFEALTPAIKLKMVANLSSCQETIEHEAGIDVAIPIKCVELDMAADLDWLTKKMEENGSILIEHDEYQSDSPESKIVNELITEFKNNVLKEFFTIVSDNGDDNSNNTDYEELLSKGLSLAKVVFDDKNKDKTEDVTKHMPKINLNYSYSKKKFSKDRKLEVIYNQRTAVVKSHTPNSLLGLFGQQISTNFEDYVSRVTFSEILKNQEIITNLYYDFDNDTSDLETAEIMIWRKRDGIKNNAESGKFWIPDGVEPIDSFTYTKDKNEEHKIAWSAKDPEDVGYYYQIRFIYSGKLPDLYSPKEIMTKPILSFSRNLSINPNSYMFYRNIPVTTRIIDFDQIPTQEVIFTLLDAEENRIATETIILSKEKDENRFIVRGPDKEVISLTVSKVYHYSDGRAPIKTETIDLIDNEVVVTNPIIHRNLMFLFLGKMEGVDTVIFTYSIKSDVSATEQKISEILDIKGASCKQSINLFSLDDIIEYEIEVLLIDQDGSRSSHILQRGTINPGDSTKLNVNFSPLFSKNISLNWKKNISPKDAGYKYIRVIFLDENYDELKMIEFTGNTVLSNNIVKLETMGKIFYKIEKKERGTLKLVSEGPKECTENEIVIKP